jgi:hypothetical protein
VGVWAVPEETTNNNSDTGTRAVDFIWLSATVTGRSAGPKKLAPIMHLLEKLLYQTRRFHPSPFAPGLIPKPYYPW